jgi:hypothetical protein
MDNLRDRQDKATEDFRKGFENQSLKAKVEQQEVERKIEEAQVVDDIEEVRNEFANDIDQPMSEDELLEMLAFVESIAEDAVADINDGVINEDDGIIPNSPIITPDDQAILKDLPFEILTDFTQTPPEIFVMNGGFYDDEKFAATNSNGESLQTDFSMYPASTIFSPGNSVWAVLKIDSDGDWDASLATAAGSAPSGGKVRNVLIGKIGSDGSVVQYVTGHISVGGGEGDALPEPTTEYMNLTVRNVAESEEPPELRWVEDWVRWPEPES